jgi:hypothetical protein
LNSRCWTGRALDNLPRDCGSKRVKEAPLGIRQGHPVPQ